MPEPRNCQVPSLSTFAEISHFCNPTTAASTAMVGNDLLRSVILELLENAKVKALEEGKKLGRKEEIENKKNMRNKHMKTVGEKGTNPDSRKAERNVK